MLFVIDMPATLLPIQTSAQIVAGEGNSDGSPVFDGDHPVSYFSGFDSNLMLPRPELVFADGFER